MKSTLLFIGLASILVSACHTTRQAAITEPSDTEEVVEVRKPEVYNPSETMVNDLVHTKLEVRFNWQKQQMDGKATITLHPHFYPTDSLVLDARGMDIHTVALVRADQRILLKYSYSDKLNLRIQLDRSYKRDEQYTVYIDYTAKPEELETHSGVAISSDKGLYFINADGKEKGKPKEIWTQGETQSNSVWLPTIDRPNQKMTQEIYMTVDTQYVTLSNGLLIHSTRNPDGTRTDYWKQSLPAAPYLFAMIVGDYAIVKDRWRNIEVNYYVEHEYEKYAKLIFGNTPEMLEFYSKTLGVDYPWEKYSQVAVRDFVSGAQENTTAVVHGEFVQQDSREYLDGNYEQYICHELFHHWFGDLLTTESWANIPLNEGFATYGEYLWFEHKFGRDFADMHGQTDLVTYQITAREKDHNLIYYNYSDREDAFDAVSYQKGGRVLHMLRKYVGDEAFFAAIKLYLTTHKFSTVELSQLRLAFEQITGEDLNWFFNQWFLDKGYPVLTFDYRYNDSLKLQAVNIRQVQNLKTTPLFRLPVDVDIYTNGKAERHRIWVSKEREEFTFPVAAKPDLVNVDAEKQLLCKKTDNHNTREWVYMFYHAPLYMDRAEAINKVGDDYSKDTPSAKLIMDALDDKFWNIRNKAINFIGTLARASETKAAVKTKLMELAEKDEKADVRASAVKALAKYYEGDDLKNFLVKAVNDSSYDVMASALNALAEKDKARAMELAKQMEDATSSHAINAIADIYAEHGDDGQNEFFLRAFDKIRGMDQYSLIQSYGIFLAHTSNPVMKTGIDRLLDLAEHAEPWYIRLAAMNALGGLATVMNNRETLMQSKIAEGQKKDQPSVAVSSAKAELDELQAQEKQLRSAISAIKGKEKDKNLVKMYKLAGN